MRVMKLSRDMAIRKMDELINIDREIPEDPWTIDNFLMHLDHKWEYSYISLDDDYITGFLICSLKENNIHIHRIAVLSYLMKKRIGRILMTNLYEDCRNSGIMRVTLKVKRFNSRALVFFDKLGFKIAGTEGERYICMKELK